MLLCYFCQYPFPHTLNGRNCRIGYSRNLLWSPTMADIVGHTYLIQGRLTQHRRLHTLSRRFFFLEISKAKLQNASRGPDAGESPNQADARTSNWKGG